MNIDVELVNNIITSGTTLVVGAIGAIVAYKGTLKGAQLQIDSEQENTRIQLENERQQLEQKRLQQVEFTKKAVQHFISGEIRRNLGVLNIGGIGVRLGNNEKPFQYGMFNPSNMAFEYQEYNNLKYELVKFETSEIKEIIAIYDMFRLIEEKKDIEKLDQSEYDNFKQVFNLALNNYFENP